MDNQSAGLYIVIAMLSCLSVTGTCGNATVIYIFYRKEDTHTYTTFLLAKAITDLLTCLLVIPFTIYMEYFEFYIKYDFLCKLYQFSITSAIPYSAFLIVAIAVHMYLSICHPFIKVRICTVFRAKILCVCLSVVAACIGIFVALMYGVNQKIPVPQLYLTQANGTQNVTMDSYRNLVSIETEIVFAGVCQPNFLILGEDFMDGFQKFYTALFAGCLVIIIIMYSLIYYPHLAGRTNIQNKKSKSLDLKMSKSNHMGCKPTVKDTELTSGHPRETEKILRTSSRKGDKNLQKTAQMLFVVAVAFFVTYFPAFLMADGIIEYNMVVFYMYFANNVVNQFIYLCMSKTFRHDIKRLICRCNQ